MPQLSTMMNLYLPGGGLGRGRVWRAQGWAGGQQSKPWLGTLNSGLSPSSAGAGRTTSAGGSCSWAGGNDLPYIQQRFTMFESADSLGEFCLPSPTSDDEHHQRHHQRHQLNPVTSSPVGADDVIDDVKRHSESFELPRSLYVCCAACLYAGCRL